MSSLTTIPPEILLTIISHLPSSSHLLALTQTSTHLRAFTHTHAAQICNIFINTRFPLASSLLRSAHDPNTNFLIPTHPLIKDCEDNILGSVPASISCDLDNESLLPFSLPTRSKPLTDINRSKIRFTQCPCPSCRDFILPNANGYRVELNSTQSFQNGHEMMEYDPQEGCRSKNEIKSMTRLSQPGPQYLVFLERYAWDIEARWRMVERKKKELEEKGEAVGDGDGDQWDWEFMVGKYCVERFLRDAERVMRYTGAIDPPSDDEVDEFSSSSSSKDTMKRGLLRKKLCRRNTPPPAKNSAGNSSGNEVREKGKQKTVVKVKMMFGEIEKGELKIEKETWVKGLLWYARPRGIVPTSTPRTPIEEFDIPLEHSSSGKVCISTKLLL